MSAPPEDLRRSITPADGHRPDGAIGGVSFTFAWRMLDRVVSLVSTPILARILAPEDFGLVGMASIAAGLIGLFLDLGVTAALVQQRSPTPAHYDAAWTLRLIQTMVVGAGVFAVSWPAADYFSEPRLVPVIQVVSLTSAIAGLENIGTVLFLKNLDFRSEFKFFSVRRLATFAITMLLAFTLRSYWAIIFGALAAKIVTIILSYAFQPFRPRLSLERMKDILSFSQWSIVRGIGSYISGAVPSSLLGRHGGAASLGILQAAGELAFLASEEIIAPLGRVLYPKLVQARESEQAMRYAASLALSVQFMLAMPACAGLALVANEAVATLLGAKWMAAVHVLELLAISYMFGVLPHTGGYALMALGRIKIAAAMVWVEALLNCVLVFGFLNQLDALLLAKFRIGVAFFSAAAYAYLLHSKPIGLAYREILGSFIRPLFACALMACCLLGLRGWLPANSVAALLVEILVGAAAYVATIAACWVALGKPAGAERFLIDKFSPLLDAAARRLARSRTPAR